MQVYQAMLLASVPIVSRSACTRILNIDKPPRIAITGLWMRF